MVDLKGKMVRLKGITDDDVFGSLFAHGGRGTVAGRTVVITGKFDDSYAGAWRVEDVDDPNVWDVVYEASLLNLIASDRPRNAPIPLSGVK